MGDPTKPISATKKFTAIDNKTEMKEILSSVYNALVIKGYNPINQLVGYILSEDPTYITNYNGARTGRQDHEPHRPVHRGDGEQHDPARVFPQRQAEPPLYPRAV